MSNILLNSNVADIALPTDLATSQQLNRDLLTLVVALQARVKQLESELVAIKERLNDSSVNSSSPPSRDTPEQRAQRERKPKSGLKRGGQLGPSPYTQVSHPPIHWPSESHKCSPAPLSSRARCF